MSDPPGGARAGALAACLAVGVGLVTACGGAAPATPAGVVAGEGSPPPAIPDDFPLPAGSVIGATQVDYDTHRSEMTVIVDTGLVAAVQFFTLELVSQGYVVEGSQATAIGWMLQFRRGELAGSIAFTALGDQTEAVVEVNGT